MLSQIRLTNFKCFKEETTFPLSKFNLFTGINGSGKSTLLQSLLLMRQSIEHNPFSSELILNGNCVLLGSFDDVRNRDIPRENPIIFEFLYRHEQDTFSMGYHLESKVDEMSLAILKVDMCLRYQLEEGGFETETVYRSFAYDKESESYFPCENYDYEHGYNVRLNNPLLTDLSSMLHTTDEAVYSMRLGFNFDIDNIHFISADRIGPQEFYLKSTLSEFPNVGTKGEFTVNLLDKLAQELVNETLCLGEDARTLITQTQAWLGTILNPLTIKINPLKVNILELLIGDFKPSNVGFGYSSLLPIIVTGLIAKAGEKIIIENPEIHLHPKAQSALIEFLVKVANTGVQIFIESHSDHVLNALRVATKENRLSPEDTSILFFATNSANNANNITSILIDEKGKLHKKTNEGSSAKIPKGFFDEWTNSMAKLF